MFGEDAEALIDTYERNRPGAKGSDLLVAFMTDHIFRIPVIRVAETQAEQGRDAFMYWFTYESQVVDFLKACHALELPFVFGTLDAGAMHRASQTPPMIGLLAPARLRTTHRPKDGP